MNRQRSLVLLVVSLGLLFLAVPRLTRAMPPPGGIKFCLFTGVCEGPPPPVPTNPVQRMTLIFHAASDLDSGLCYRLKNIPVGDYDVDSYGVNYGLHRVAEAFVGQSVAVSLFVWLKDNQSAGLPLPLNQDQDQWAVASWLGYPMKTFRPGGEQWINNNGEGYDAYCNYFNTTGIFSNDKYAADPKNWQGFGYKLSGQRLESNNGHPSLVLTILLSNLPAPQDGSSNTTFTSNSFIYDRANSGNGTYPPSLEEASSSFNLRQIQQSVNIGSGDVAVKNGLGDKRILLTNGNGQTVVTNNNLDRCSWDVDVPSLHNQCLSENISYVGLYLNNLSSTANLVNAKLELKKTLSKLAQETAEIDLSTNQGDINNHIRQFLAEEYDIWRYPRGRVLIFGGNYNNLSIDSPGDDLTVRGRKLIVFSPNNNYQSYSVIWKDYPVYADDSGKNKLAAISLSGSQVLEGNISGSQHFDGAFIATTTSPNGPTDNRITIGGTDQDYPHVTINGLLMADQIAFTRHVNPAASQVIATINYDPSFQNGGLLGLSPFIRPLVSAGGNQ